ncbi:carboxypeptidase-like regulatory domain-containing protein [Ekhidna sp.]
MAQQTIKGKAIDSETQEPVAFANVFFSGTLIGSTTDIDGNFSFEIPVEGKYELIISYIGYKEFSKEILTNEEIPFLNVELEPEVIELKDIEVEADTTGWADNYTTFKRLFLGETQNAVKVDITNPKDIFLFYDPIENGLFAHSRKEIVIENKALGYRIGYAMKQFGMEYKTGQFYSFGIPRFQEIEPKGKGQAKRWEKARAKAYNGSFVHFLKSYKDNSFTKEGYKVHELFRIPNRNRPPEELIQEKIRSLMSERKNHRIVIGETKDSDSLSYWMRMRRMPLIVDSIGLEITDNSLLEGDVLNYKGYLRIVYTKEPEESGFSRYRIGGGVDNKQTTIAYFANPITIYDNGYYDVANVFFEGYMGWSSKIAEMLPLEYLPQSSKP